MPRGRMGAPLASPAGAHAAPGAWNAAARHPALADLDEIKGSGMHVGKRFAEVLEELDHLGPPAERAALRPGGREPVLGVLAEYPVCTLEIALVPGSVGFFIETAQGARKPSMAASPKAFRVLFVLVTDDGVPATASEIAAMKKVRQIFCHTGSS